MTQEENELIFKDLLGRLPYGVVMVTPGGVTYTLNFETLKNLAITINGFAEDKPYLRPMSSMTEEEYNSISWKGCNRTINYSMKNGFQFIEITSFTIEILNWLNAHHFDYRGLIEKGLALEAPKDMY